MCMWVKRTNYESDVSLLSVDVPVDKTRPVVASSHVAICLSRKEGTKTQF